ncbi:MAG: sulfur carrier protein ThiS [Salinivirgaceae bacterium]|jgi:sulfur carrier protein|nr:sulfur carrier protein ThiS [Salinivirgaceae bacterium]
MKIVLNNRDEEINAEVVTIKELLEIKNFTFRMLVVKVNGVLVKKDRYEHVYVTEGDNVIVLHLVSGG